MHLTLNHSVCIGSCGFVEQTPGGVDLLCSLQLLFSSLPPRLPAQHVSTTRFEGPNLAPAVSRQVLIQDGYLLEGTLCKKTLGASGGSLIHIIFMEAGPEVRCCGDCREPFQTSDYPISCM